MDNLHPNLTNKYARSSDTAVRDLLAIVIPISVVISVIIIACGVK